MDKQMERERPMVVDCRPLQEQIKAEIKTEVKTLNAKPVLAIIRIGEDYASGKYVAQKVKHGEEVGFEVNVLIYPECVDYNTVKRGIIELNNSKRINGIILQLPLPTHLAPYEQDLLDYINPIKDVDCMTTLNIGRLSLGKPLYTPCTPQGIIDILHAQGVKLRGMRVGVIGRSNIVGKPLIQMLLAEDARVTIYHSKCDCDEYDIAINNDIIISAVGKTKCWKFNWSDDTILIDVGINFDDSGKMCGDMDLEYCTYDWATPVPNGVGRMTVSALLKNTLKAYKMQNNIR